jgi:hypothetical protein
VAATGRVDFDHEAIMGAVPGRRQYPLWTLMAATAGVALLLAFRRWLETHPDDLASPDPRPCRRSGC